MNVRSPNPVLLAALGYAERGWPVFPCSPVTKQPLVAKESAPGAKDGGLHLATTDVEQIEAWWRKWPRAMIGVPTGPQTGNVLDLDLGDPQIISGRDYLDRLAQHVGGMPATAVTETGSGGLHLWFAWDDAAPVVNGVNVVPTLHIAPTEGVTTREGKKAKGAQIDIRGRGGYVIVPPSVRSDGRAYAWCPEPWDGIAEPTANLARILTKAELRAAKQASSSHAAQASAALPLPRRSADAERDGIARYAEAALDREIAEVAGAGAGTRNHCLNTAAFRLAQLVAAGALSGQEVHRELEAAADRSGLVKDDGIASVRATIASGFQAGSGKPRDLSGIGAKARRAEQRQAAQTGEETPVEGGHASDAQIQRIAIEYPIPKLSAPRVFYEVSRGRVMLHKEVERKGDKAPLVVPVTTPFGVTARLRYADRENAYGLRVAIQDMAGKPRYIDIDRADLARQGGAPVRELLFREGLKAEDDGEHVAVRCLKAAAPAIEIAVLSSPGWHEIAGAPTAVFVGPDGSIAGKDPDTTLELATSIRLPAAVARSGTFEGWQDAVGVAVDVECCEHWTIGVCAAFVGPLLSLTGLDTCGINLSGLSSSGKSTAQRLAVSAWSSPDIRRPGLAYSAKSTVNAMEALAARANGTVFSLDEMAHVSGLEVAKMIYTLAGGVGRRRMTAEAALRESHTWATFALFSSECSLEEKVKGERGDWSAGMAARFADVDVTSVNRSVERSVLDRIAAVDRHHGHAGPLFVQALVDEGQHREPVKLRERILARARQIAGNTSDSAKIRSAIPFALLRTAGLMAIQYGLLPQHTPVVGCVDWAWGRFMRSSDARALDPEEQVIANLQSFILARWGVTIRWVKSGGGAREAEGWFDDSSVYLPRHLLRAAAGNVMTEEAIASVLHERGLLTKTEKDRAGLYVRYVPGLGKGVNAYALRRGDFGREEDPPSGYATGRGAS